MIISILIIDDKQSYVQSLKEILQGPNIRIDTAVTFHNAMELLETHYYDIVISDIGLTGASGKEGLDILRYAKRHKPHIKVILMTGQNNPDIRHEAYHLGVDLYWQKPVSPDLFKKVAKDGVPSFINNES
jgi:DNA-binding NtrC family response regulator